MNRASHDEQSQMRFPLVVLLVAASTTSGLGGSARAEDDRWSVRVGPGYVDVQGHDPQVLNVDGPASDQGAFRLETESDIGRHLAARYRRSEKWAWGKSRFALTLTQSVVQGDAPEFGF